MGFILEVVALTVPFGVWVLLTMKITSLEYRGRISAALVLIFVQFFATHLAGRISQAIFNTSLTLLITNFVLFFYFLFLVWYTINDLIKKALGKRKPL